MQNKRPEPSPDLLKRYLAGKCSREEEEAISTWYRSVGENREELDLPAKEEAALKRKLWSVIRGNTAGIPDPEESRPRYRYKRLFLWSGAAAAACILLLLFFPQPGTENSGETQEQDERLAYRENKTDKTLCLVLPDTSLVWLQPGAGIAYTDFREQAQREVTLSGEAFFEVSSHPQKPFIVYSGEVVTRVLGTKFNIKAHKQENTVEVTVTEGVVEVTHRKEKQQTRRNRPWNEPGKPLLLKAHEKIVYHQEDVRLVRHLQTATLPVAAASRENARFEFDDVPLKKVVNLLENVYQLDIELENEALNHCTLTASLNGESLDTKLKLICKSIGAAYRRDQNKIFISGDGCTL